MASFTKFVIPNWCWSVDPKPSFSFRIRASHPLPLKRTKRYPCCISRASNQSKRWLLPTRAIEMNLHREHHLLLTRRQLFGRTAAGIGTAALASLLNERLFAADADNSLVRTHGALPVLHFAPKAKHVIYLFMSGGPSHIDLFDDKPKLKEYHGQELPASIRMGQRIRGMTSGQKSFPCVAPMFKFAQHGQCGAWVSELLPHTARIVDDIAIVKS